MARDQHPRAHLTDRGFVTPSTASRPPTNDRVDDCFTATFERSRMIAHLEVRPTWADQFRNAPCLPRPGSIADGSRTADVYSPVPCVPAPVGFRVGRAIGGATGSILGAANISADPMTLALARAAVALTLSGTDTGRDGITTRGRLIVLAAPRGGSVGSTSHDVRRAPATLREGAPRTRIGGVTPAVTPR